MLSRIDTDKAEIYQFDGFLEDWECDYLVGQIDKNHVRSKVVSENEKNEEESDFRTSSSSFFSLEDNVVERINQRMHDALPDDIPLRLSEEPQGQKYEPGQYFKDHTDYFDKDFGKSYTAHIGKLGQRNWTFMIYLNDVEEGGETEFERLGMKFYPKKGRAIIWKNLDEKGEGNCNTLHAGRPPKSGNKYIITKWFRDGKGIGVRSEKARDDIRELRYSSKEDLPKLHPIGFELRDLPSDIWGFIQDIYILLNDTGIPEPDENLIKSDEVDVPSEILNLNKVRSLKKKLHEMLLPMHREWISNKYELVPSSCYGIRSYNRGATLEQHYDRVRELHVSGIILVDEKSDKPWGLDIQDWDGNWHNIKMKPGQILLYESATLSHGRDEPFEGEYYRNFYVHYRLKDWEYVG